MKKFFAFVIALVVAFSLFGCGFVTSSGSGGGGGKPGTPDDPNNPGAEESVFTATLLYNGKPLPNTLNVSATRAIWTSRDGSSISSPVPFTDGVASIGGLDGDYAVTLTGVPRGYTYNPNIYFATNDNRDVKIELYAILPTFGEGSGWYNGKIITITQLGAYRFTFDSANRVYYCQYEPKQSGTYSIESINDVNANEISPYMDVHIGTTQYKPPMPNYTIRGGGASGTYTKNFKYEVFVSKNELGNVYGFVLRCDSGVGYPVELDIIITRDGDFERGGSDYTLVVPQENFFTESGSKKVTPEYPGKNFRYLYRESAEGILDSSRVGMGEDGYYHLRDSEGNLTDTILYTKITTGTNLFASGSPRIDYSLIDFTDTRVNMRFAGKDYTLMIRGSKGMRNEMHPLRDLYANRISYIDCVNSDGMYAVTEELRQFLQGYSESNLLFFDGDGYAEMSGMNSSDENQWLFAVGYYY